MTDITSSYKSLVSLSKVVDVVSMNPSLSSMVNLFSLSSPNIKLETEYFNYLKWQSYSPDIMAKVKFESISRSIATTSITVIP